MTSEEVLGSRLSTMTKKTAHDYPIKPIACDHRKVKRGPDGKQPLLSPQLSLIDNPLLIQAFPGVKPNNGEIVFVLWYDNNKIHPIDSGDAPELYAAIEKSLPPMKEICENGNRKFIDDNLSAYLPDRFVYNQAEKHSYTILGKPVPGTFEEYLAIRAQAPKPNPTHTIYTPGANAHFSQASNNIPNNYTTMLPPSETPSPPRAEPKARGKRKKAEVERELEDDIAEELKAAAPKAKPKAKAKGKAKAPIPEEVPVKAPRSGKSLDLIKAMIPPETSSDDSSEQVPDTPIPIAKPKPAKTKQTGVKPRPATPPPPVQEERPEPIPPPKKRAAKGTGSRSKRQKVDESSNVLSPNKILDEFSSYMRNRIGKVPPASLQNILGCSHQPLTQKEFILNGMAYEPANVIVLLMTLCKESQSGLTVQLVELNYSSELQLYQQEPDFLKAMKQFTKMRETKFATISDFITKGMCYRNKSEKILHLYFDALANPIRTLMLLGEEARQKFYATFMDSIADNQDRKMASNYFLSFDKPATTDGEYDV